MMAAVPSIMFLPRGQHLLADLSDIAPERLDDPHAIEQLLREAALSAGATILSSHFHHFGTHQGVTGVVLLAESHISIHTWPESGFAALDIFMCGNAHPEAALQLIRAGLAAGNSSHRAISRGGPQ